MKDPSAPKEVRVPKVFLLPGWKVWVKQVTGGKMKALHGDNYDGLWDIETRTIYINKYLPLTRKWYVVGHEYAHVVNDWVLWLGDTGKAKS